MKTLIVPCVGSSFINDKPKYLAYHPDGKILVQKCIEGIPVNSFNRIIFSIVKKDVDMYSADCVIIDALKDLPVEVIALPKETTGPAETVYQTIQKAQVHGSIVVKDYDNFLRVDNLEYRNFVAGLDLNEWNQDVHHLRNKSFLILNEQKQILDVFEKQIKSDVICLGLYGFADVMDYVLAYEKLNDNSYPIKKLYVSHIISYLIGYSQRVFRYVPCTEYENWGNDIVWAGVQNAYATYFVDLDNVKDNINCLKKMSALYKRGAKFVGFTVQGGECKETLTDEALKYGFSYMDIVCNISYSCVKRVIKNPDDFTTVEFDEK